MIPEESEGICGTMEMGGGPRGPVRKWKWKKGIGGGVRIRISGSGSGRLKIEDGRWKTEEEMGKRL